MNFNDRQKTNLQFTARDLKWIACVCMLADHIAKGFHLTGIPFVLLSDVIGRVTFPVFCMLLAEGFFHTRSRRRYFLRVLILALISEIPFDLALGGSSAVPVLTGSSAAVLLSGNPVNPAFAGTLFDWSRQNTCFTLALGLLMFSVLEKLRKSGNTDYRLNTLLQLLAIGAFAAAAMLLHTDYEANGIVALAVFYYGHVSFVPSAPAAHDIYLQKRRDITAAAACLVQNLIHFSDIGAFLSLIPLHYYTGRRGMRSAAGKYAFYLFYPAHLIVIAFIWSQLLH